MTKKYKIPDNKVLPGNFTEDEIITLQQILRDNVNNASDIILNLFPTVLSKKDLTVPVLPTEIPDYKIGKNINNLKDILDYYVNVNNKYIPSACGCLGPKNGEALCPCAMKHRGIVIHGITFQISIDEDNSLKLVPLYYTDNFKLYRINGQAMEGIQFNIYSQNINGEQKLVALI